MPTTATYITASKGRDYVGPGCDSSTTEGLRSKSPGVKRRQQRGLVHFDPSLNWSIEEEKSFRGYAARRERQQQKRMERATARERKKSVLQILKDPNRYDQIKRLYNADVGPAQLGAKRLLQLYLHEIIGYREGDTNFQQQFERLQNSNLTYETLSVVQQTFVNVLSENELFVKEFSQVVPAEPVSDGASSDDSRKQRKNKRRKKWETIEEVVDKRAALNNGGPPPPPAGPNQVV